MKTSDEAYFRTCVALERRLAHLLGHDNIEELDDSAGVLWDGATALPKWTRDWNACGPLLAKYTLTVRFTPHQHVVQSFDISVGAATVHCCDHPSSDHALRHAIVKAVIILLEHNHHQRH